MVTRRPVVFISGQQTELPPGDFITGASVGTLTAGSGLDGGGNLSSTETVNISLAPNASGLIFVDDKYLASDGVAQRIGEVALASGVYALEVSEDAVASGTAGSLLAATALASGNAALADIAAIPGGTIETFTAASAVASGYAVGLDDTGSVQSVRITAGIIYPTVSTKTNFIGIAQDTAASGTTVPVRLPGSYDQNNQGLVVGSPYYVDPTTSGFTTTATQPAAWSGAVNWAPVGVAVNSTTLLLTDMI
jgi:hypothetical protein